MVENTFRAFVVREEADGFVGRLETRSLGDLPDNDVLVKVCYSSLNYKDALSVSGNRGITRNYPHTPGIDATGSVVSSKSSLFRPGDRVVVTGYDLGMNTAGGFADYIRVPVDWLVRLPQGLTHREAMILGTAGLTAALSVFKLSQFVAPEDGPIAVSGASGGVGSLATAILAQLGYTVLAVSGKQAEEAFLLSLGADAIIPRVDLESASPRPLLKGCFAGAVDTVGGTVLSNLIKLTKAEGAVTCCGNVASADLDITVYPFILRGISLLGIDSQNCPLQTRELLWNRLATIWKPAGLLEICREISLSELNDAIVGMLAGRLRGRTIVHIAD
ncbi:YhdH/YhfP family quinone oxidoreductase [Desulfotalea psychrophila]|uniref:Probable oxidoreductase n=1 Tax=Desulfotalea psychrophila (strain LSv54 / DSM 12343) TaxID=177439 RepID=Q6AJP8_DESPS|nr:YhdH/YhfP family quinone oxidoreductase [Desulfotalea psychrophila]CAG37432.1 probable oxidoreductase [Desulfotalea psychrophila LSv54]